MPSTCHLMGGPVSGNESIRPVSGDRSSRFGPRQPTQDPECTRSPGGSAELVGLDSVRGGGAGATSFDPTQPQPDAPSSTGHKTAKMSAFFGFMNGSSGL